MIEETTEKGVIIIYKIYYQIWTTGEWPKEWCESIYIPINKKGDKEN